MTDFEKEIAAVNKDILGQLNYFETHDDSGSGYIHVVKDMFKNNDDIEEKLKVALSDCGIYDAILNIINDETEQSDFFSSLSEKCLEEFVMVSSEKDDSEYLFGELELTTFSLDEVEIQIPDNLVDDKTWSEIKNDIDGYVPTENKNSERLVYKDSCCVWSAIVKKDVLISITIKLLSDTLSQ